jgi:hypothetical protein
LFKNILSGLNIPVGFLLFYFFSLLTSLPFFKSKLSRMKKFASLLAAICFAASAITLNAQQAYHRCSSMEYLHDQLAQDPGLAARMQQIEQQVQNYIQNNPDQHSRSVVTIPVVVHVVYNTSAQNISDALIQAQINQLNLDYARLNSDAANTPSAFASVAANTNVQFCLAQRSPAGTATTGIVRKSTTVTSFSTNNAVKKASTGGDDAWPATSYLNIWSCNLGGGLLGYAQFPGGTSATDGVVVLYSSVGSRTVPGTASPYNFGRTATHEVGHWLNLYHIWGDDGTACTGTDNVGDTPNQSSENYGCPAYPHTDACSPSSPGVMFMNYMDYTDDGCMNTFTAGQAARMNALFTTGGARVSILSSLGCQPVGSTCSVPSALSTTAIANTTATFNWSAVSGASSYNVQYRLIGTITWASATATNNSYNALGLTAGANYEWQVRTVCSAGSSAYTASTLFTTTSGATCGVPSGLTSSGIGNNAVTLSWTAVSGATSYNLQWKLSSASTWTLVSLTTNSYSLAGLTACSAYQFQVQANCSGTLSAFSSAASFTTTGCAVTYCTSKGTSTSYEYIKQVAIGSISNLTGSNAGYGNFTNLSTNLAGGASATISLTPGFVGAAYTEYWTVYIDYNHNGSFADAGEKVTTGSGSAAISRSFTVPATALNGATRLRVQMQYGAYTTNSCTTYTYGEVEDYTVNITGNAQSPAYNTEAVIDPEIIEAASSFILFPNPADDMVTVDFMSRAEGNVGLRVYNALGQNVLSDEMGAHEGNNTQSINIEGLSNGVYIFEVLNHGDAQRREFTISK